MKVDEWRDSEWSSIWGRVERDRTVQLQFQRVEVDGEVCLWLRGRQATGQAGG